MLSNSFYISKIFQLFQVHKNSIPRLGSPCKLTLDILIYSAEPSSYYLSERDAHAAGD